MRGKYIEHNFIFFIIFHYPIITRGGLKKTKGSGRVHAIWQAIEYVNEREDGIADVGDSEFLSLLSKRKHPFTKQYLGNSSPLLILSNFLAEYLFCDQFVLGYRHLKRNDLYFTKDQQMEKLARQMKEGGKIAIQSHTGISSTLAKRFNDNLSVNPLMHARQMAFWMQNNAKGYLTWIKRGRIPDGIFDEKLKVFIDNIRNFRGFNSYIGFAYDGKNPDIGNVNGPDLIEKGQQDRALKILLILWIREVQNWIPKQLTLCKQLCANERKAVLESTLCVWEYDKRVWKELSETHRELGDEEKAHYCDKQYAALCLQNAFHRSQNKKTIPRFTPKR